MKANLHTHTVFCDGSDTAEEMVLTAIEKGFDTLGFSGHSYTEFDREYCMNRENTAKYKAEIGRLKEKYRGEIEILLGVEQDYFSNEPTDGYDYVIGSVHYILKDGIYCPVDNSAAQQKKWVENLWGGDWYAYAADYFALAGAVTEKTGCDIIGHFDLVTKFNEGGVLFDEADPRYACQSEDAARRALKAGVPFEINTGAMAKGYKTSPYPSKRLIDFIKANGGSFVINSDCHSRDKLDFGFEAAEKLINC